MKLQSAMTVKNSGALVFSEDVAPFQEFDRTLRPLLSLLSCLSAFSLASLYKILIKFYGFLCWSQIYYVK